MIVTFEPCGKGREVAKLGALEVGIVRDVDLFWTWQVAIGLNASVASTPAQSGALARRALVYRLAGLLECMGADFAGVAQRVRAQADAMSVR